MKIRKNDITKIPAAKLLEAYRSVGTPMTCHEHYTVGDLRREILRRISCGENCPKCQTKTNAA